MYIRCPTQYWVTHDPQHGYFSVFNGWVQSPEKAQSFEKRPTADHMKFLRDKLGASAAAHRTFMVHAQNDYEAALDFLDEQRELRAARQAKRMGTQ
jgi:hypothetical protein